MAAPAISTRGGVLLPQLVQRSWAASWSREKPSLDLWDEFIDFLYEKCVECVSICFPMFGVLFMGIRCVFSMCFPLQSSPE